MLGLRSAVTRSSVGRSEGLDLRYASSFTGLGRVVATETSFLWQDSNTFRKLASGQCTDTAGLLNGVGARGLLAGKRSSGSVVDVGVSRVTAEFCKRCQ